MATQDDFIRTALRVPPDLHKQIHEAAEKSNRTFNAEIVARLQQSFDPLPMPVLTVNLITDENTRASEVKDALEKLRPYLRADQSLDVNITSL